MSFYTVLIQGLIVQNMIGLEGKVMRPTNKGSINCTGSMGGPWEGWVLTPMLSVRGPVGGLGFHTYDISKLALVGLLRSAWVELREFRIGIK